MMTDTDTALLENELTEAPEEPENMLFPAAHVQEFSRRLGRNLRATRMAHGLSLAAAGALFPGGLKPQTLRSWEAGLREMTVESLVALAGFYGVAPAALVP